MEFSNRLLSALTKAEGPSFGLWNMIPDDNVARILARTPGCDWVLIDCEHGNIDDRSMHHAVPAVASAGASPIVRIPATEPWMIKRALDAGAHGILVPLVQTVVEARDIVQAAKFPLQGRRGFGSTLPMERFMSQPTMSEYLQQANKSLLTMIQIETQSALDNLEEIAVVDGIDLLFVGPFDLGNSIGYPIINGNVRPELKKAISHVRDVAHKAGKKCGIYSTSPEHVQENIKAGFDMIHVATDLGYIRQGMAQQMSLAQGRGKVDVPRGY